MTLSVLDQIIQVTDGPSDVRATVGVAVFALPQVGDVGTLHHVARTPDGINGQRNDA